VPSHTSQGTSMATAQQTKLAEIAKIVDTSREKLERERNLDDMFFEPVSPLRIARIGILKAVAVTLSTIDITINRGNN